MKRNHSYFGSYFGLRWQSAAATLPPPVQPSFESGVALGFPRQSKITLDFIVLSFQISGFEKH